MNEKIQIENNLISKTDDKTNLRKTILLAALIFLIPFGIATFFGFFITRNSPLNQETTPALTNAQNIAHTNMPACSPDANVTELLEYRQTLRLAGVSVDAVNIRIWAAAENNPALLLSVSPPAPGLWWNWRISKDGRYALAIASGSGDSILREVALYSFKDECWLWQKKLPWPKTHEDPWVFNDTTIIRSSKNNHRFAMEISPAGDIVSIDPLGKGGPFPNNELNLNARITGTAVALRSNVCFSSGNEAPILNGYALKTLPGLYDAGPADNSTCFSGTGLLKFTAEDGTITIRDSFTGISLYKKEAWTASSNTVVSAIQSNRDGSEVTLSMISTFNNPETITRPWNILLHPATDELAVNMSNTPTITKFHPSTTVRSPDGKWIINLRDASILEIFDVSTGKEIVEVDLKKHINCRNNPITQASLLTGERFIVLRQRNQAHLLDLHVILHYGDVLARLDVSRDILDSYTATELSQTNLTDNAMREIDKGEKASESDSFNYEMSLYEMDFMDPHDLEPPALPSILSLQAEYLSDHHAWLYATMKLERLMNIQEQDNRAPKANPLLYTRYSLLSKDSQRANNGCIKGLESLFYDQTPYNLMIRFQMLKTLFQESE